MTALMAHGFIGLFLPLAVGIVLGLLGGGGSILALPIFLYVFQVPTKPAVAMSLAVVGMSAFVGFLGHWRQGTVSLRIALPFGAFAMLGAFVTARLAHLVPERLQLGLFMAFALTAAVLMLRDAARTPTRDAPHGDVVPAFGSLLAAQALGVGVLTSLIGAGGGFVIVPALVLLARVPVKVAVGSSLLIITMNALSGFVGYMGSVPIDWPLVTGFTGVAAVGALAGTRLVRFVPQRRIKQGFAILILVLGAVVVARSLGLIG
ncbi:MAG: sulfite exporter TauE/SafE family protein [Gemmatimonadetes bacterium]|nr:sulfite exporter TauE/SafE family protein [Gemmatimonadota bacterium]